MVPEPENAPVSRAAFVITFAVGSAAAILACSFRDITYLQVGPAPAGTDSGGTDAVTPEAGGGGDGSVATRTATVVAPGQLGPRLLTQDDTTLYWVTNDGNILALKKDGSESAPRPVAPAAGVTFLIAEEGAGPSLFYASDSQVFRVDKAGGMPAPIGTTDPAPRALAADSAHVFVMGDDDGLSNESAGLYRFQHDGGAPAVLRRAELGVMYAIALRGNDVFWDEGDEVFLSLPKSSAPDAGPQRYRPTGATQQISLTPQAFTVDDQAFFYSDQSGDVRTLARQPASAPTLIIASTSPVEALAIDGTHVYALETTGNGVLRRNTKDGRGTAELMLDNLAKPSSLVVDATTVFIAIEGPPGAIVKCAK